MKIAKLAHRALLSLKGVETRPFLQGLLSKDLNTLDSTPCVYSFLLNAKGRIVADLIVYKAPPTTSTSEDEIFLETDADKLDDLERLLKLYRLRKRVEISRPSADVFFMFPEAGSLPNSSQGDSFADPRLGKDFGNRFLGNAKETVDASDYMRRRLEWGIGEGNDELGNQIPLNVNGDFLKGISFDKGCYIGQELVARTHFAGVIRSRLLPFTTTNKSMKKKTTVVDADGKRRGKVVTAFDGFGISIVSFDGVLSKHKFLSEDGETLDFSIPKWWPSEIRSLSK